MDKKTKGKILSIKWKLPQKLEDYLSKFFKKYEKIEKNIIDDVLKMIPIMYLKTIQDIENKQKKDEEKELLSMEKQIEKLI